MNNLIYKATEMDLKFFEEARRVGTRPHVCKVSKKVKQVDRLFLYNRLSKTDLRSFVSSSPFSALPRGKEKVGETRRKGWRFFERFFRKILPVPCLRDRETMASKVLLYIKSESIKAH